MAIGVLMTEGRAWHEGLGPDADKVVSLGSMPVFRPGPSGGLHPDWD